jgi:hypothetical protein
MGEVACKLYKVGMLYQYCGSGDGGQKGLGTLYP